jgi:hypothetical protein
VRLQRAFLQAGACHILDDLVAMMDMAADLMPDTLEHAAELACDGTTGLSPHPFAYQGRRAGVPQASTSSLYALRQAASQVTSPAQAKAPVAAQAQGQELQAQEAQQAMVSEKCEQARQQLT